MEFLEKAKIMIERGITHSEHHREEYESLADQLEEAGKVESAGYLRELRVQTTKSTECLRKALEAIEGSMGRLNETIGGESQ